MDFFKHRIRDRSESEKDKLSESITDTTSTIKSTSFKVLIARNEISSRLPMGVATTKRLPDTNLRSL